MKSRDNRAYALAGVDIKAADRANEAMKDLADTNDALAEKTMKGMTVQAKAAREVDDLLGRLVTALEQSGHADDTAIVF